MTVITRVETDLEFSHLMMVVFFGFPVVHQNIIHGEKGDEVTLAKIGINV